MIEDELKKKINEYKIFVDEPELKKTVLDFPNYIKTLSEIIFNSDPKFTMGIFGDWGTGKTTLMENIQQVLENKDVNCLRFNAWRYEGESRQATFPMMLNILGNLLENPTVKQKFDLEDKWKRQSFIRRTKRVLKGLSGSISAEIPGLVKGTLNVEPEKMMEKEETEFDDISNFYNNNKPILQEGYEIIKNLLTKIDGPSTNPNLKLVVFIDDLDRCTPEKAAQVFESIKVFFDIFGIVFVLGLSRKIVEAAIDVKYEEFVTKQIFEGSDYIKKIIQVPFALPPWTKTDIKTYLKILLKDHTDIKHVEFLKRSDTIELISEIVESNPRDVKRLLNNFILVRQIFENEERITNDKLLLTQILVLRWKWFYDEIFKTNSFRQEVIEALTTEESEPKIQVELSNNPIDRVRRDKNLVHFLSGYGSPLLKMDINEWQIYQRTSAVDLEYSIQNRNENDSKNNNAHVPEELLLEIQNKIKYQHDANKKFAKIKYTERSMNPLRPYSKTTRIKLNELKNEINELEEELRRLRSTLEENYENGYQMWDKIKSQYEDPYFIWK